MVPQRSLLQTYHNEALVVKLQSNWQECKNKAILLIHMRLEIKLFVAKIMLSANQHPTGNTWIFSFLKYKLAEKKNAHALLRSPNVSFAFISQFSLDLPVSFLEFLSHASHVFFFSAGCNDD